MSKRFIDTGFLDQKWIRKLSPEKKIFLIYLMLKCDNGGIIDLDMEDIEFWIGKKIGSLEFLPKDYLIPINESGKYFMPKFIDWQYKDLTSQKFIVAQARQILEKHNLINPDFTLNLPNSYIKIIKNVPENQEQDKDKGIGNGIGIGIEDRKNEFMQLVYECDPLKYDQEMLSLFCTYWTEKNKSGTKMKFELEKTFEIKNRLDYWKSRAKTFNNKSTKQEYHATDFPNN
jgi:hypothetical protein